MKKLLSLTLFHVVLVAMLGVGCGADGDEQDLATSEQELSTCGPTCESLCLSKRTWCADRCDTGDFQCEEACNSQYYSCYEGCACPSTCSNDFQCPSGNVCNTGICTRPCRYDLECQSILPQYCSGGDCECRNRHCVNLAY